MSALVAILMSALANLPVGMAPGMGSNAYFTYSVVGHHGSGCITYREVLTAVWAYVNDLLALCHNPLFLLIQWLKCNTTNLVGPGGCLESDTLTLLTCRCIAIKSDSLPYFCGTQVLQNPTAWLGIFTDRYVTTWHPLQHIGNALDVWYALITFLYVDILDTTGTLYSMVKLAGLHDPVPHDFENSTIAYCVDAFSISMGALAGTSPVTPFIKSATGIAEGVRLVSLQSSLDSSSSSVFFAPIFASIPPWATSGALIIVGSLMIHNVCDINWDYVGDALPAFLTILSIPLSYKQVPWTFFQGFEMLTAKHIIVYCVIVGMFSYVIINSFVWIISKTSNNAVMPPNYDTSEPWIIPPEESPSEYLSQRCIGYVLYNALNSGDSQCSCYTELTYLSIFSFYILVIANAASALRVSFGLMPDRISTINNMAVLITMTGIVTIAWPFAENEYQLVVIASIYGFSLGAYDKWKMRDIEWECPPMSGAIGTMTGGFTAASVGYHSDGIIIFGVTLLPVVRYLHLGRLWGKF
ncbi:hypothetical protein F4604DRAFT_1673452 [Suillus subluteus]|nr:hypothetical protein F4604DRAFT_1673452 [Suillus subluteus]